MDSVKLYRAIKSRIVAFRKARKWSYADMARVLSMTRSAASQLEKADGRVLIEHLYNLAFAANVRVGIFLP